MPTRITRESLYLRHDFTDAEVNIMAKELAQAYNRRQGIDDEEAVMKTQIKEKRANVDATVGSLSRKLNDSFEMVNVQCELVYDLPNVGEVSYKRTDNGEIAKVRPMTEQERQLDLPLEEPATEEAAEASVEKSQEAVDGFFGTDEAEVEEEPADPRLAVVPKKSGPKQLAAYHEAELEKEAKQGRGKKKSAEEF